MTTTHIDRSGLPRHPKLTKGIITKLADAADLRWICDVVDSGYHNGARCNPREPHGGDWACGYYWRATVPQVHR